MIAISIANSVGSRRSSAPVVVVPVATAATGVGETSFTANWNAFAGANYYLLDVSLNSSFSSFVGSYQNYVTIGTSQLVSGLTPNTTYYYRLRAVTGVDSDAAAFFSRVYTAGGVLSYTEVTATETLVYDMKTAGLWTAMKAVYPMVGASAAACAQNLKSSSFTGTFTSGWTFASTGVTGNGSSTYMDPNLTSSANLSLNSAHISFYSRTNSASSMVMAGTQSLYVLGRWTNYHANNSVESDLGGISTGATTAGFFMSNRTVGTQMKYQINGSIQTDSTSTAATASISSNKTLLMGCQNSDYGIRFHNNFSTAFYSLGDGLTDTQASNFYTAVQTFNQTLNRQVGAQIVSDADAQAYINRVYTAGGTLTNTEANAVNQLVIDMKGAGIWTAMKAVYPMVGASAAACAQNLKSSSFTGTFSSGWTFASTGVTPNGTSAYFDTTLIPNTHLTFNSASFSGYSRNNFTPSADQTFGCTSSATYRPLVGVTILTTKAVEGLVYDYVPPDYMVSATGQNLAAMFLTTRTSATSSKLFRNTTQLASATTNNQITQPTSTFLFGAFRGPSSTIQNYNTFEYAFAHIGDGLTDTQASDFYTAVQIFNTTLGRQVAG